MSPEAVLYYGFHLGCPDDGGWEVAEADEYGNLSDAGLEWLASAEDEDDYPTHMTLAILATKDAEVNGLSSGELAEKLAEHCKVQVVDHGSRSNGIMHYGIALAGTLYRADDWTPKQINPSTGCETHQPLLDALAALGLSPNQTNPSWILAPGDG